MTGICCCAQIEQAGEIAMPFTICHECYWLRHHQCCAPSDTAAPPDRREVARP